MSKTVEQLDKMGEQSLQWLNDFAEKGIEFVQTQAPDLCREIVNLGLWQWGFLAIMWLCISCAALYGARKLIKALWSANLDDGVPKALTVIICSVCGYPLLGFVICLYNWVTIYAAPKVYLVNYFVDLYTRTKGR